MVVVTAVILHLLLSMATADDVSIMVDLLNSLKSTPPSWSTQSNPCKWLGVGCDSLARVTLISLGYRSLSGTLPSNLGQLSNLKTLSLEHNNISGSIPTLANMTNLKEVFLNNNHFTHIDSSSFFANLPNLETFMIDHNPLDPWTLPGFLSGSFSLKDFRASNCNIIGHIPNIMNSLPKLQVFSVSYNSLSGPIPRSFANSSIETLWIHNQKQGLSGSLNWLSHMPSLVQVWAQGNSFVGPIPDLSNSTRLFDLQLGDNRLYGILPRSITALPNLLNISLQNNIFQGPIPIFPTRVEVNLGTTSTFCSQTPGALCDPQVNALLAIASGFGYPRKLARSWLGSNACNNWAYVTCDSTWSKVIVLNFSGMNFSGFISPAFGNITSLTSIILNDNFLLGAIPDELTNLELLQTIDVSNNNLTGKIPKFSSFVLVKTDGNPFLGLNIDKSSLIELPPSKSRGSTKFSSGEVMGIVACTIVLVLAMMLCFCSVLNIKDERKDRAKSTKDESNASEINQPSIGSQTEHNSLLFYDTGNVIDIPIEVILEATNKFNHKNILGRGGFGVVYKGVLYDGSIVAVKRMDLDSEEVNAMTEFQAEISVLSEVRHRNLVTLLGFCIDKNERIVVYEFMSQGTLEQHLFEFKEKEFLPLSWRERLVIALDVARGVEYLHSLAQQSFIHHDLKPSNILLDEDMRAKVADFGLVKNAPDRDDCPVETRLAGTFGYLAPEYASAGRVTTKIDIFSFGVVLMQLITGRKAIDERLPEDETQLVTWFRRMLLNIEDNIERIMDPRLHVEYKEILDTISKVAHLSGYCTAWEPCRRPDMSHIVNILAPLVDHWHPTEPSGGNNGIGLHEHAMSLPETLQRWRAGESITESSGVLKDSQTCYFTARSILVMNNSSFSTAIQDFESI